MSFRATTLCAVAVSGFAVFSMSAPSHALTAQECRAKYQAARKGGTLGDQKWNEFRKAQCGPDATPAAAPVAPAAPKQAAAPAVPGGAVFPTVIDRKYSKQRAGRARRLTCIDQYNANKATNANGGMKWIQRGGGYYSECNRRLKGA
jgi:hypothetical protein